MRERAGEGALPRSYALRRAKSQRCKNKSKPEKINWFEESPLVAQRFDLFLNLKRKGDRDRGNHRRVRRIGMARHDPARDLRGQLLDLRLLCIGHLKTLDHFAARFKCSCKNSITAPNSFNRSTQAVTSAIVGLISESR